MKKLGCDNITIVNDGIVQQIKRDEPDFDKEFRKLGYKLYDEIPFGVIRQFADDWGYNIIVNQDWCRIEFYGTTNFHGGSYIDDFGDSYDYELIATMGTSKNMKGTQFEDGHLEDICAFAKRGFEKAEFPYGY